MNQPKQAFSAPDRYTRDQILDLSRAILGSDELPLKVSEDIFRIESVGLEWDLGVKIFEPVDPARIARDAAGKKIGIFLLHGGDGDSKSMEPMARLYASHFGYKAMAMTFPGRLYLDDPSRDWPGNTINTDGTVRTPMWKQGEYITPDQYDVVRDVSQKLRYGTRVLARAKPGSNFYDRMAGWPIAFVDGMIEANRRHFPDGEYGIYGTGHSTGGPMIFMICQRVPNFSGVIAAEHSPFGFIQEAQHDWSGALGKVKGFDRVKSTPSKRHDLFNELYIRTWRDCARYAGPEALGREGPSVLMRLPSLMEEVLDWWDEEKMRPQFKAEYIITHNIQASLEAAARVTADRLALNAQKRADLVALYKGLPYPLTGAEVKPVPNVLFAIAQDSRDHSPEVYAEVVGPMMSRIDPQLQFAVTRFEASTHFYHRAEDGLPVGIGPAVAHHFHQGITRGFFM
jgi:hypothetical protein